MGVIDYGATEAGVVVMAIPCLVLFLPAPGPLRPRLHVGRGEGMTSSAFGRTPYHVRDRRPRGAVPLPARLEPARLDQPPGRAPSRSAASGWATTSGCSTSGAGAVQYFLNSTIISVVTVCLTLAISVVGGYAFARFTFPGRDGLFLLTLAILMVPYGTLLIPMYVLLHAIGLQNSLLRRLLSC